MSARNNGPPRMSRSSNSCSRKMIRSNGNERVVTELGCHTSANGHLSDMHAGPDKVCLWGKTGSDRPTVKTALLTN
jgi:hypothetical protein